MFNEMLAMSSNGGVSLTEFAHGIINTNSSITVNGINFNGIIICSSNYSDGLERLNVFEIKNNTVTKISDGDTTLPLQLSITNNVLTIISRSGVANTSYQVWKFD